MYTLRCTRKLLDRLGGNASPVENSAAPSTTRLGDWYAKPVNIGRNRLVLCTNARTLLSVVVPAKNLPGLPLRLAESMAVLLTRLRIPAQDIAVELEEMAKVRFDRTMDRSILGSMNDFAVHIDYYFHKHEGAVILSDLDYDLSEIPCGPLGYGQPRELARELFAGAV